MFRKHRSAVMSVGIAVLSLALGIALSEGVSAQSARDGAHAHRPPPLSHSPMDRLMMRRMAEMDDAMAAAPMTGDPDRDFSEMMIPHHRGAIEMARLEQLYGKDLVLRRLAAEIIVTQAQEITVMKRQLAAQRRR